MVKKRSIILTGPEEGDESVIIPRPASLAAALEKAKELFPSCSKSTTLALHMNVESGTRTLKVRVTDESWGTDLVVADGQEFVVGEEGKSKKRARENGEDEDSRQGAGPNKLSKTSPNFPSTSTLTLNPLLVAATSPHYPGATTPLTILKVDDILVSLSGTYEKGHKVFPTLRLSVSPGTKLSKIFRVYASYAGRREDELRFLSLYGDRLSSNSTCAAYLKRGGEHLRIDVVLGQCGGR